MHHDESGSSEALALLRYFPYTTALLVAVLAIVYPEILGRALDALSYYMNISSTAVAVLVPVVVIVAGGSAYLTRRLWLAWQLRKERQRLALQRIQREREILVELFEATNGNRWKDKTRWKSSEPVHRWKGVKVEPGTGFVNKIILPENELSGNLPDSLGELQGLTEIDLRENDIDGTIPRALAQLRQLQGLYLHTNRFTGKIPDELADLPLTGIYLFNNNLEGKF